LHPGMREGQDQILESQGSRLFLKFYFNFQFVSNISRENNFRSVCNSIQFSIVSRNSRSADCSCARTEISSSLPLNRPANPLPGTLIGIIPDLRQSPQCSPSNRAD